MKNYDEVSLMEVTSAMSMEREKITNNIKQKLIEDGIVTKEDKVKLEYKDNIALLFIMNNRQIKEAYAIVFDESERTYMCKYITEKNIIYAPHNIENIKKDLASLKNIETRDETLSDLDRYFKVRIKGQVLQISNDNVCINQNIKAEPLELLDEIYVNKKDLPEDLEKQITENQEKKKIKNKIRQKFIRK